MPERLRATLLALCTAVAATTAATAAAATAATSVAGTAAAAIVMTSAVVTAAPSPLGAQARGSERLQAERATERALYLRSVGRVFRISAEETELLTTWLENPAELPVLLHLAARSRAAPDVVGSLRRSGASWQRIATRLGLGTRVFHVELGEAYVGGILARPVAAFRERPPGEWHALALTDLEIVALVNVRVLAEAASVAPAEVAALLGSGAPDYVSAYAELARTRAGRGDGGTAAPAA